VFRFEPVRQLISRLGGYPWWEVLVEVTAIWLMVYLLWRFIRGTRAAAAVRVVIGFAIVTLLIRLLIPLEAFSRLAYLFDNLLGIFALAVVVIFQPELRRALIRLGEADFFRPATTDVGPVVDAIVNASVFLSKNKFGAIIAIEQKIGMREFIESGRLLNADVSAALLQSIFWPNNPLHDMGVVIRGDKILAAGVQFPLAEPGDISDRQLGTRHSAAIGLTRVADAIVITVSEETGSISLAQRGQLEQWLTPEALRAELTKRMVSSLGAAADDHDDDADADHAVDAEDSDDSQKGAGSKGEAA
jgi:diadenylate cyclase